MQLVEAKQIQRSPVRECPRAGRRIPRSRRDARSVWFGVSTVFSGGTDYCRNESRDGRHRGDTLCAEARNIFLRVTRS